MNDQFNLEKTTYYVLDATGNVMATYDKEIDYANSKVYLKLKDRSIYGSSRVGVRSTDIDMLALHNPNYSMKSVKYEIGKRTYELSNHLGNVLSVISDKPIPSFEGGNLGGMLADVRVSEDYSPFGVTLSGRSFEVDGGYLYSFQGQEHDDEIKGKGNSVNYKFRMHDPRLGRFFAVDPLFKDFQWNSPYAFCENSTIAFIELEGLEKVVYYWRYDAKSKELIAIRDSKGNQIHGIYPDGTKNYHTVIGLFINGKYKEISGDVLNASCELMKNGNKVNNIKWDRERSISESWASFAKTTHGKNFIQTIKNVATVASMVVTGGTLGVATKFGKVQGVIDLGISLDDLSDDGNGNTFLTSKMSKEGQVLYSSLKLAYGAFQKGQATMRLDKPKPTTKDFADYVNANYKVVDGSLELKKFINKKETKK